MLLHHLFENILLKNIDACFSGVIVLHSAAQRDAFETTFLSRNFARLCFHLYIIII
jgi:hypothetical protein